MLIEALMTRLVKNHATNVTTSAFAVADTKPTFTKPAASATRGLIIRQGPIGQITDRNTLIVVPYGGDANNDVINVKVFGWSSLPDLNNPAQDPLKVEWVSRHICEVSCILSSALLGLAGMNVVATEFFADTLSLTTGFAVLHNGTADIDTAWFECDTGGYEIIEVKESMGAGGDQANCLVGFK